MILDSSALVAIVLGEPGYEELLAKVKQARPVGIGTPTLVESLIVLARRLGGDPRSALSVLLRELLVEVVPFEDAHTAAALHAYLKYGKGRHRAGLNFGDCLAYATAKVAGQPLLWVGDEFGKTDVKRA